MIRRICIFCGSNSGVRTTYREAARRMAVTLAQRGVGIVYGGGRIMGIVSDAAIAEGGEVMGVIPKSLVAKEVAHDGLTDLRVVGSMHERKALMAKLSDAFIALPGGFGTLEEFSEEGIAILSKNVFLPDTIVVVKLYAKNWFMVLDGIVTWLLPDLSTNRYKMGIRFSKTIREFERYPVH